MEERERERARESERQRKRESQRERERERERVVSPIQTAQGTTTAWISVVDFNGDMSNLHDHEAAANAVANNWLEVQRVRDSMPSWGEVNQSEPAAVWSPCPFAAEQATPGWG